MDLERTLKPLLYAGVAVVFIIGVIVGLLI